MQSYLCFIFNLVKILYDFHIYRLFIYYYMKIIIEASLGFFYSNIKDENVFICG